MGPVFLSVFLLLRFIYPLGRKEIDALQAEKEKPLEKAGQ